MNLQHQLDNTTVANGSSKERNQVYWGKTIINQWLFTKSNDGPQATKLITTNKKENSQQGRSPTVPTTASSKNDKDCQVQQQPTALHTSQIPTSPSQGKPPPTKSGRLIQPNNLLKVLTANVQTLSPNIDDLIALIQVENFDVIELNETWLDTRKQASACWRCHTWLQGFSCIQTNSSGKGTWTSHVCQKHLEPNRNKVIGYTSTSEIIHVDINPKNAVYLKLVLIYRNTIITAADHEEFYIQAQRNFPIATWMCHHGWL